MNGKKDNTTGKNNDIKEKVEKIKALVNKNRAAALGFAVFFTVSSTLTGCTSLNEEDEDDDSYYYGGGGGTHISSYYYGSSGTYKSGSWSKASISSGSGSYSHSKGGSIGG